MTRAHHWLAGMVATLVGCGDAAKGGDESSTEGSSSGGSTTTVSPTTTAAATTAVDDSGTSGVVSTTATSVGSSEGESEAESGPPADCAVADPLGPGDHERMIDHDGVARRFIVHVPEAHDGAVAAPLLVNMHGLLSNPEQQVQWSEMNAAADPRGYIGVYPAGTGNSWNAGSCCGSASSGGVDDVGFIRALVADVSSAVCIDPQRVYGTGMSNGGHMSFRLACEAADIFAALAPVAGAMRVGDCAPGRPVPVFAFHGVQDLIVPYADDVSSIDGWAARNGCDPEPVQEDFTGGNCRRWQGCDADAQVGLCTLDPMGHCWPGGSEALCFGFLGAFSDALDANTTMLDFFEQHTLP